MRKFLTILPALILFSCANDSKEKKAGPPPDTTTTTVEPADQPVNQPAVGPAIEPYFIAGEEFITIRPFEIDIALSPKAEAKMARGKETIMVDVFFTGTPKNNVNAQLEEDGSFYVADAKKEIVYGQVAKFENIKFSRKIYDQLADKDIELAVNVYSGRKSSPDNLLNADGLFDKVSKVVNKRSVIKCKLIYGDE